MSSHTRTPIAVLILTTFDDDVLWGAVHAGEIDRLTERELGVLRLMAQSATNNEIADQLYVSERTVKSHVGSIFVKLGAKDRAAAIVLAFRAGLAS